MMPALLARLKSSTGSNYPKKEVNNYEISRTTQTSATLAVTPTANTEAAQATGAVPQTSVASEARNSFLISQAGHLRSSGLNVVEIRDVLLTLNETRYGGGRHPRGPLAREELERTIFQSIQKWEATSGVVPATTAEMLSMSKLMKMDLPPTNWIVPELLTEGLTLLAGKPKVGKSWLVLDLALICSLGTASSGRQVLGRYPVEPIGVFYLSLEDNAGRLRKRVEKLRGSGDVPDTFRYALRWKSLSVGGLQDLEICLMQAPETRLVIIDTLASVRKGMSSNTNAYQEEYNLMAQLQALANDHHLAVVVLHHLRKSAGDDVFDEISGTLGLTGAADTSIILKRGRTERDGILYITGRDVEEQELAMTFKKEEDCTWNITGSVAERQVSQARQEILDLLEQNGTMTPIEIAKTLEKPRNNIQVLLKKMVTDGLLMSESTGRYCLAPKS